ncbi:hypothetical protein [Flavobacterium macacae]|uniref:Uncharacterized protein n=1 Tax=Flavobacterium macacae TaxID=2488993 RepID=A0A3P3WJ50_9FLAO|nr:hypothetical protein [Flavobacterium macacae]RRJ94149.1 hypothetical protein EG849_01375 [Flavobacterium macacae]
MSSITPNTNDQEIDLGQVSKKIGQAYEGFLSWIFRGFLFVKRNLVILIVLFIIGAGLGYYLDKNTKVYDHEVIVNANFSSVDYAYSKVNLINSKIGEGDISFLKAIGIKNPKLLREISIEPINDVYQFAEQREHNFELLKLMAEDGDINKVMDGEVTSKNYKQHKIKITTNGIIDRKSVIEPILTYLNSSEYFTDIQKSLTESTKLRYIENEKTIAQIDAILATLGKGGTDVGDKMVYYNNENTQLNDVLITKNKLIQEQAFIKVDLISSSKIIKDNSSSLNVKNKKGVNGKKKVILPLIFIGLFVILGTIRAFYRSKMYKIKSNPS